jgi:hypothetical protein
MAAAVLPSAGWSAVFVSVPDAGTIIQVDTAGAQSVFASGLGRPGTLRFDPAGHLFVLDGQSKRVLRVDSNGAATVFTTLLPNASDISSQELLVDAEGAVFSIVQRGGVASEIWRLRPGAAAVLVARISGVSARGGTLGPDGEFYLALQQGKIVRVTHGGQVSTFYEPATSIQMIDARFTSAGDLIILSPQSLWKVSGGTLTLLAPVLLDGALQLALDASDRVFISGGGFGGGQGDGFVQEVDANGVLSTLTTFPGSGPVDDIDDSDFDFDVTPSAPQAIPVLSGIGQLVAVFIFVILLVARSQRRQETPIA